MTSHLYMIGDIHGKIGRYRRLLRRFCPDGPSIQVGDMYLGMPGVACPDNFGDGHYFIRGNHDNPQACAKHRNYLGDIGYSNDWRLAYVGGAWSRDFVRSRRVKDVDWWEDEELSSEQLQAIPAMWSEWKPRIIVTHDAPILLYPQITGGFTRAMSRTALHLDKALRRTDWGSSGYPKYWFFGHHHKSVKLTLPGISTTFIGLNRWEVFKLDMSEALQ